MPVLLFRLRNVPEDEAEDIRKLLETNEIEFYETTAGNWGISTAAIWLKDNEDLYRAKEIIDEYQSQRGNNQREIYEQLKNSGKHKTLGDSFKENPYRFIAYIAFVAIILYFSIKPFINLSK